MNGQESASTARLVAVKVMDVAGQGLPAHQCVPNSSGSLALIQARIQRSRVMIISTAVCKNLSTTENQS